MVNEAWQAWVWVVAIDLVVVIAAWIASTRRDPLERLLPHHVAAAVIVALIGWETLVNQLGTLGSLTALSGYQLAFFASQLITGVAAATATVYLLRRRAWAVVLGVGVCVVRIVASIIGLVGLFGLGPDFVEDPSMATTVAYVILLTVPAMVGIWLLVDPFLRGRLRWPGIEAAAVDEAQPETVATDAPRES
jgi:hypothetical protein